MNNNYDEKAIVEIEAKTTNVIISNEEELKDATELLKSCKLTIKEIEADRVKITKPINDSLKEVNARYKIVLFSSSPTQPIFSVSFRNLSNSSGLERRLSASSFSALVN